MILFGDTCTLCHRRIDVVNTLGSDNLSEAWMGAADQLCNDVVVAHELTCAG